MTQNVPVERDECHAGFTLMEVAIAIVVLAVGVLSVFGLLGGGLDNSSKAVADTRVAMFAESVLNGIRANSAKAAEMGEWQNTFRFNPTCSVVSAFAWGDGSGASLPLIRQTGNGIRTLVFTNHSFRTSASTDIVNHALRYRLNVTQIPPDVTGIPGAYNFSVMLKVWDGQFGRTDDGNAFTFYSEYSNLGNL